jgi:membrane-associated phospholipid phosphatase
MFQSLGFIDTLGSMNSLNHGSGFVQVAANPYAAMPSLHAADALIVGVMLITVTRRKWLRLLWALWPLWVWFCVMATANHFWLDVVGGIAVALLALVLLQSHRFLRLFPRLA